MKVVIAMDSFKGSITSLEAGNAAREGILRACPGAEITVKPLADGGEGTLQALTEGLGGRYTDVRVTGPLGNPVRARYGILGDGKTAVMEIAQAAGITLLGPEERDPHKTSTAGVGEMIADAVRRGCRELIIGIGGSATTEGGIGMLTALGYVFYGRDGEVLPPEFSSLGKIARVSGEGRLPELEECRFRIACDVTNPLCGENGAVRVYGPQKRVKPEEAEAMDAQMAFYAAKTAEFTGRDYRNAAGAGAAGGLGFAFLSYFPQARLCPGAEIVLEASGLEKEIADADVVVTGEGRIDRQTAMGKAPAGVARLAKKYGRRVIAFAGSVSGDAGACGETGIDAVFPILREPVTLEEAMKPETAKNNLRLTAEQVFRIL